MINIKLMKGGLAEALDAIIAPSPWGIHAESTGLGKRDLRFSPGKFAQRLVMVCHREFLAARPEFSQNLAQRIAAGRTLLTHPATFTKSIERMSRCGKPLVQSDLLERAADLHSFASLNKDIIPDVPKLLEIGKGDWVVITPDGATIRDRNGIVVEREVTTSGASAAAIEKGNYRHFMQKEIFEQPTVVAQTLRSYIRQVDQTVALPQFDFDLSSINRVTIVACGTSYYAGMVAKYWFEQFARLPADIDFASEFRYREPVLEPGGLALFISQSGETADTLAALRHCKDNGQTIAVVVNVPTSSMAREADLLLPTHAGPEIGVASTKAFSCQLAVLAALAAHMAVKRGLMDRAEEAEVVKHLLEAPASLNAALVHDDEIAAMAHLIAPARDVLYLGRGQDYPLALEGALKLKEISYIHAEGYASGEMKHGPIALIDEAVPVIVIAPSGPLFEKTVSNMQEVRARGGKIVLISDREGLDEAGEGCLATIEMPKVHPLIAPLVYAIPVQLLAYHVACVKGTDVDQPRNLAKSVTVE